MKEFKSWLSENSMSPMFQLAELSRQFSINCDVGNGTVTFSNGSGPVAEELHGKTLVIGTWEEVKLKRKKKMDETLNLDDMVADTPEKE